VIGCLFWSGHGEGIVGGASASDRPVLYLQQQLAADTTWAA